jgi:hypothetical protein
MEHESAILYHLFCNYADTGPMTCSFEDGDQHKCSLKNKKIKNNNAWTEAKVSPGFLPDMDHTTLTGNNLYSIASLTPSRLCHYHQKFNKNKK